MGLYEKIYSVMCDTEALDKSMTVGEGKNSYKAVSEAEVLNKIKPLLKKHRLVIFPIDGELKENSMIWEKSYKNETTTTLRAVSELKVKYKIVDIDTGESETLVGFGNGADSQDKGAGKASTYSYKNMLSKTFMLFSGEDTDNEHSDDIDKRNTAKTKSKQEEIRELGCIPINDEQLATIRKALKALGYREDDFCTENNIEKLEYLPNEKYQGEYYRLKKLYKETFGKDQK